MHIHASLIAICGINIQGYSGDNSSLAITTFVLGHVHDHVYSYVYLYHKFSRVMSSDSLRLVYVQEGWHELAGQGMRARSGTQV